jgi:hypothetical protein
MTMTEQTTQDDDNRTPQEHSLAIAVAAKFIELEQATDSMSLDDIYARYQAHEWDVLETLNGDADLFTTKNDKWTEKGLRHFLALLELFEFLVPELEIQTRGAS